MCNKIKETLYIYIYIYTHTKLMKNTQNTQPKKKKKPEIKTDNIPNNNIKITDISEYFFNHTTDVL